MGVEVDWKDAYRGTGGLTAVRLTATIQTLIYTDGVHAIEGKPTLPLGMGRRRKPLERDERSNSENHYRPSLGSTRGAYTAQTEGYPAPPSPWASSEK
jgi:hypothetical protein